MSFRTGDEGVGPAVSRLFRRLKDYVDGLARPEPWIPMGLVGTGWANYGAGWAFAAYRKVGDVVQIRGLIGGGAIGATIAVMPDGYRPLEHQIVTGQVDYGGGGWHAARIDILSDGVLRAYWNGGPAAYLSINMEYSTV